MSLGGDDTTEASPLRSLPLSAGCHTRSPLSAAATCHREREREREGRVRRTRERKTRGGTGSYADSRKGRESFADPRVLDPGHVTSSFFPSLPPLRQYRRPFTKTTQRVPRTGIDIDRSFAKTPVETDCPRSRSKLDATDETTSTFESSTLRETTTTTTTTKNERKKKKKETGRNSPFGERGRTTWRTTLSGFPSEEAEARFSLGRGKRRSKRQRDRRRQQRPRESKARCTAVVVVCRLSKSAIVSVYPAAGCSPIGPSP